MSFIIVSFQIENADKDSTLVHSLKKSRNITEKLQNEIIFEATDNNDQDNSLQELDQNDELGVAFEEFKESEDNKLNIVRHFPRRGESKKLYATCLHALQSRDLQMAFAAGDTNLSDEAFKSVVHTFISQNVIHSSELLLRKSMQGYNVNDMLKYLNWLKDHNHITSFTWKHLKMKDWHMHRVKRAQPNECFILFGYEVTPEMRPTVKELFEQCEKTRTKMENLFKSLPISYDKSHTHCVSVGAEEKDGDKSYYFYDNGSNIREEYSLETLAERISYPFGVRRFIINV